MSGPQSKKIEIWGGIECSLNRVLDQYFDQLEFSGHYTRREDMKLIAGLGIKKIRYPVLWEKCKPDARKPADFSSVEPSLNKLRELKIEPIAGLVHHGSGPPYAGIETEHFPKGLEAFAHETALKFSWINYYTPVNEPLTTARFCGLYGHWHPHHRDTASCMRLLINECKATVLAMKAVRKINPHARLLQTEDQAKTYATELLQPQAAFENKRRWLSLDLLSGKVKPGHFLWDYLLNDAGLHEKEFEFLAENPCPPDIIGFNYYPTSERYIDERIEHFPPHCIGGNGIYTYADVEAVRVQLNEPSGLSLLLKEAWERFKTPMVLSEVHLGCSREEQMRWLQEIYETSLQARTEGIDIRAITAWSLLGSFGWNKLLTDPPGIYETGVFDISSGKPRPTALANQLKSYASGKEFSHPVIKEKGWWRCDRRIIYFNKTFCSRISSETKNSQPVLIVGKNGTLGKAFAKMCGQRGIHYQLLCRQELDITNTAQIEQVIAEKNPWAVINAAGFVRVDDAENETENCFLANTYGPAQLASACKKAGVKLLTFSSDLVFNGKKKSHYLESDTAAPLNIYGKSKAMAEKLVIENNPAALIIRTSAFFGPWDEYNFVHHVRSSLKNSLPLHAANDIFISPTYVPDLVNTCLDLLIDNEQGVWHLANNGETTWAEFAFEAARRENLNTGLIVPSPASKLGFQALRPAYSVLNTEKGMRLPFLENALDRYFEDVKMAG